jgi:hypothetical protein
MRERTVCRTCLEVREEVKDNMESHDDGLDCGSLLTGREVLPTPAPFGMLVGKVGCRGNFSSTGYAGLFACPPWADEMVS